jgi:hypothetical protein
MKWSDDEVAVLLTAAVAPAHTDRFLKALSRWSRVIGQRNDREHVDLLNAAIDICNQPRPATSCD